MNCVHHKLRAISDECKNSCMGVEGYYSTAVALFYSLIVFVLGSAVSCCVQYRQGSPLPRHARTKLRNIETNKTRWRSFRVWVKIFSVAAETGNLRFFSSSRKGSSRSMKETCILLQSCRLSSDYYSLYSDIGLTGPWKTGGKVNQIEINFCIFFYGDRTFLRIACMHMHCPLRNSLAHDVGPTTVM